MMDNLEQIKHYHLLFLANITLSLGIEFSLDCCAKCQTTQNIVTFDLYEGGYLCIKHAVNKEQASLTELRTINQLFRHQVRAYLTNPLDEVFAYKLVDFINQTYGYQLSWE